MRCPLASVACRFRSMGLLLGAAVAAAVAGVPGSALADSITLRAVADTTIYAENDRLSNGSGSWIFSGNTGNNFTRRSLLRFDLSSIPAGAFITDAALRVQLSRSTVAGLETYRVHRLNSAWGEGSSNASGQEGGGAFAKQNDATWRYRLYNESNPTSSPAWSTLGGDFVAEPSSTAEIDSILSPYTFTGTGLILDVQSMIASPASNFGWILIGNETAAGTAKRFVARETGTVSQRPTLVVTYSLTAPTGACCLPDGSCVTLPSGVCASAGGTFQGVGVPCAPGLCPLPTGACCLPDGSCNTLTQAACAAAGGTFQGAGTGCSGQNCPLVLTPFVDELPVPGIMQPTTGEPGGAAHYDITITEFTQKLHRDLPITRVWGYNGTYPARTIEARRGFPVTVNWINNLRAIETGQLRATHVLPVSTCLHGPDQTGQVPVTVTHLHGGRVADDSDGDPDLAFPPGQSSPTYFYPNDQQAATIWYHDHALGLTRLNVYMGLAGFYLIRDDQEESLNLPRDEFDVPLAIQDRSFNADGSLKYPGIWEEHTFGDFVLVNGKVWPFKQVKRGKYRFRLLNGSNSRAYTLALSNGATFHQIASEQGLLEAPVEMTSLTFTPGERADVVIDFASYAPGTEIILTNSAPSPFPVGGVGPDVPNVMKFIVGSEAGDTDPLPAALGVVERLDEADVSVTRTLELRKFFDPVCGHDKWLINGLMWNDITEFPRVGATEIWAWVNRSGVTHPMHMHLVEFQVLDRQDFIVQGNEIVPQGPRIPASGGERGWKDTVQATPNQITRVIVRFPGPAGTYPYHCHILEHEDHEMMRQFTLLCDAPTITSHPVETYVREGSGAALSVGVAGSLPQVRWLRNGAELVDGVQSDGTIVSGAGETELVLSNVRASFAGTFAASVTGACGAALSVEVALSVGSTCDYDFNQDENVDLLDAQQMAQVFVGIITAEPNWLDGDLNGDENADLADAQALAQYVVMGTCP